MTQQQLRDLYDKNLITQEQFDRMQPVVSGEIISVFYELRTLLYLGILLFTSGLGILIYQNIGQLGHILSLLLLAVLTVVSFTYVILKRVAYTHGQAVAPSPYYDYVVLLGCLLLVSVIGYAEFQFGVVGGQLEWITLFTALLFFAVAYRFDHLGILSMAITAFVSFWGIRTSIARWAQGDFFNDALAHVAIALGVFFTLISTLLDKRGIKPHFTFTYQNFGLLLFFIGAFSAMWNHEAFYGYYVILIYAGCATAWYLARWKKSFLFLLYAFLAAYIATTTWLADVLFSEFETLWFFYSAFSCGALIYFVTKYRNAFRQ